MAKYSEWGLAIHEIRGKIDRGELIPDPDWQRNYIWKLKDKILLIDSIFKEIPIPKFYLTEEYDEKKGASIHYVVDGQQRLKAIYGFLTNKFPLEINGKDYYFKDLDHKRQQKITTYKLHGHYLTEFNQADINFLFQRLNTTGIKLSNMEIWNNKFTDTKILSMAMEIEQEHKAFYHDIVYTAENIKRKLPLDDIIDLCSCLSKNSIEGGAKKDLESFLKNNRDISGKESASLKSKFRKVIANIEGIFNKSDLENSLFSKRTHFISLFLAIGLLISKFYILTNEEQLKDDLLEFIQDPPKEYSDSALGAIRKKATREKRVGFMQKVFLKSAIELDEKRLFHDDIKRKLWKRYGGVCNVCQKEIEQYKHATVDHIKPWAKGGRTEESNAQLAHSKCNKQKKDKWEQFVI